MMSGTPTAQSLDRGADADLLEVACGPPRHECTSAPDLSPAIKAIDILADRAAHDAQALEQLVDVVQRTPWWGTLEAALGHALRLANTDQLRRLARYFCDFYWQPGDYGGGDVTPERLGRVVSRLEEKGVHLEDCFRGHELEDVRLLVGRAAPRTPK
jgi:hypothetical protein